MLIVLCIRWSVVAPILLVVAAGEWLASHGTDLVGVELWLARPGVETEVLTDYPMPLRALRRSVIQSAPANQ